VGTRAATVFVDYQQRASEFAVGDLAYPLAGGSTDESQAGTVVAVYPAIGQVDIEYAWGSGRYPVEDVQRVTDVAAKPPSSENTTVPGGAGTVGVPGGPVERTAVQSVDRLAHAFVKRALYWASKDRHYRGTKAECDGGKYACPKCKANEETGLRPSLRPANYKRMDGVSSKLLGCPECLFLIKQQDIVGHPDYEDHIDHDHGDLIAEWDGTMDQGFDLVQNVKSASVGA
jgi:hypothetical protein